MNDEPATGRADIAQHSGGVLSFLDGGGEMGAYIRARDWSASVLGAPEAWPAGLKTAIRIMLTTNHPVFVFWGDELTCFYNDAYSRSIGPEKHPHMLGARGRDMWVEIWPIIGPQIQFVISGQGATWHENALVPIMRHGSIQDVYWTYSYGPIHEETAPNGVGGVLVLCTETTEQVLDEARFKADADRWRLLFEQAPGFICVTRGPKHVFEYCNPAYFELVARRDNVIGFSVAEALPEVVKQGYIALLDDVYRTGNAHMALAAPVTLLGVERLVDFVYQPLRDESNRVSGILTQGVDVTARERAQTALLESASRLEIATDAAQLGIHVYDVQTGVLLWDDRVREVWGIAPGEMITYDMFMAGVLPEDREPTQTAVDRSLDPDGDGTYDAQYRVRDRSGVVRWVRATGRVEFHDREPIRMIGTVQDITKEKAAEAELIAADHRKDVFLATLAHELRNPLAPIRNAAQILAVPNLPTEKVSWAQSVIARQSSHMAQLLDDLLDVARLTQGRIDLKREVVEVRHVIDSAIETVRPQLEAKEHRLEVFVPQRGLAVSADPVRMCQVFANLLGNAIKYMEPRGNVRVEAAVRGSDVLVSIIDTGVGIGRDALKDVFGMFQQSETSLERAEGGLGIGLALVRALVELHGGEVSASSEGHGKGSTFRVLLPLDLSSRHAEQPMRSEVAGARTSGRRVLVADDNRDAAESLALLLTLHGHEVRVATDGVEALDAVQSFEPEVVLLDIGMPRMNGYDVARELRVRAGGAPLRLIALTGWGQSDDRQRAFDAGFDAHLTKPPELGSLLKAIAS